MAPKLRAEQIAAMGPVPCAKCVKSAATTENISSVSGSSIRVVAVKGGWLTLSLLDQNKIPIPKARYHVACPDADPLEGELDAKGKIRIEGLVAEHCEVWFSFPNPA